MPYNHGAEEVSRAHFDGPSRFVAHRIDLPHLCLIIHHPLALAGFRLATFPTPLAQFTAIDDLSDERLDVADLAIDLVESCFRDGVEDFSRQKADDLRQRVARHVNERYILSALILSHLLHQSRLLILSHWLSTSRSFLSLCAT